MKSIKPQSSRKASLKLALVLLNLHLCLWAAALLPTQSAMAAPGAMQMPPAAVQTHVIKRSQWHDSLRSVGTLKASEGIVVRTEIPGRVTKILFQSGHDTQKGELLVQLDDSIAKAQLQSLEAQLALSTKSLKRYEQLLARKVVSPDEFEKHRAEYRVNKAKVAEARARLEQMQINAPFAGKLGLRQISLGDYLSVGQAIVNLSALNPMHVDFSVPESDIAQLQVGQPISITLTSGDKATVKGKVMAVESMVDPKNRTLTVRASIDNPDHTLIPGMFGDVEVMTKERQVLLVPIKALLEDPSGSYVYKIQDGIAKRISVRVGHRTALDAVVLSGLKARDEVVVAGQHSLRDGAKVRVTQQF